jgi:hypothetical protein
MSQTTLLTREPVVNKNRAITANRLIAHGPNVGAVVEALSAQAAVWPTRTTRCSSAWAAWCRRPS